VSPNFFVLVVVSLAVFRWVKLAIDDDITEPLRERTVFKLSPKSKLRELFECPWCLGLWLAGGAVVLFWLFPVVFLWVCLPFAISAVVGLTAEHLG
jgi:uncharacterized protein DUF1360